ncbi:MAG: acyltransferase domain-containing protein [Clostridia bacterium]|nr:acyltransferase domain-containing protein [Clostridia bacterium]
MNKNFDIDQNLKLFEKIYDDTEVFEAVEKYIRDNYAEVAKYSKLLLKNRWTGLVGKPRLLRMAALALSLATAKERFKEKGLDEQVFFDTMTDIKIWGEDCRAHFGEIGIDEINWLRLHVNCKIFKIGRLQYQLCKYYFGAKTIIGESKIRFGEKCFNIHIPRGERLDMDLCIRSLKSAYEMLGKAFPKIGREIMICHSWMLSSHNKNFISEDSNISRFAKLFTLVGESQSASEHLRWIFDIRADEKLLQNNKERLGYYYDLSDFQSKSSMQNSAKEYIMQGGILSDGKGALLTKDVIIR